MRALLMVWKAGVSYYNEMFLFVGLSILWWLIGGFMAVALFFAGWFSLQLAAQSGFWLLLCAVPLLAIPIGPANAAMAAAARRAARELHIDRSFFWDGLRTYWRQALGLSSISMLIMALLMVNVGFYWRMSGFIQFVAILFLYLLLFWLSVQIYLFPVLVGLKEPTILAALKTASVLAFANPLFSIVLLLLAIVLTVLSIVIPLLLLFAWPAFMLLLGEHSLMVFMEKMGIGEQDHSEE